MLLCSPCLQGVDVLIGDLRGSNVAAQERSIEALASALDHPGPPGLIADALSLQAIESDESLIRRASLKALGRRGDAASVEALSGLISALPPSEAPEAVTALGATPLGRARAWEYLLGALGERAERAPFVALLEVGAVSLVEGGRSTWTQLELNPFVQLYSHPDPKVRRGVLLGINSALEVFDGAAESRAIAFLEAIEESGLNSAPLLGARVELALLMGETSQQESAARLLAEGSSLEMDPLSASRGYGYLGTARFIDGDYEEAVRHFLDQRDIAASISRRPLKGDANFRLREQAARLSASAEVSTALARLAGGTDADSELILTGLRRAHAAALNAHELGVRCGMGYSSSLNLLFSVQTTPWDALGKPSVLHGLTSEGAVRLQRALLSALAAVAPEELPGLSPSLGLKAQLISKDSGRLALIEEIVDAKEARLMRRWEEAVARASRRAMSGESDAEGEAELQSLQRENDGIRRMRKLRGKELLYAVRTPCTVALTFAASLRGRGELAEAKEVLERFLADVEEAGTLTDYVWPIELAAQAEMQLGSCLCDEDLPSEAELVFLRAVGRLEDLERLFISRGVSPASYPSIGNLLSATLISLAVNANVRLHDSDRALEYFERAYELRQDDFATVLLACYRARSGQEVAAREALARVPPSPNLYYNLTCAYALLGEKARALSFLEQELNSNHPTEGARERQRAWARDDPDLATLRSEPRFKLLTSKR
jgi:tetratricopeptide (TPR) repeat protein